MLQETRTLWEVAEENTLRTLQTRREEQSDINNVDLALEPTS